MKKSPLAQVNAVGANDELIFDGHSVVLDASGEVLVLGKGFAEDVLVVELENLISVAAEVSLLRIQNELETPQRSLLQLSAARAADFFRALAWHPRLRPQMRLQIGHPWPLGRH